MTSVSPFSKNQPTRLLLAVATAIGMTWSMNSFAHDGPGRAHADASKHAKFAANQHRAAHRHDRRHHDRAHRHHDRCHHRRHSGYRFRYSPNGYRLNVPKHYFHAHNPHRYGWHRRPHKAKRYAWRNLHNQWHPHFGYRYH